MTCFHPLTIFLNDYRPIDFNNLPESKQKYYNKPSFTPHKHTYELQIPCGHCIGCRLDKADTWATRCVLEAKNWNENCFITLTYNEHGLRPNGKRNLPLTAKGQMTLFKKDIQDFMKRLRFHCTGEKAWTNPKNNKIEKPIRYFCCGEYGPKGGRPHYHMALFNYKPKDLKFYKKSKANGEDNLYTSEELSRIWGHGFVIIGELTQQSASYIARYVQKKAGLKPKTYIYKYDDVNKKRIRIKPKDQPEDEFILMSTGVGLGRLWWEENKTFAKKWGHINIISNGIVKHKPIPRYFKKLWEKENWEEYEIFKYENMKKAVEKQQEILAQENYNDWNDDITLKKRREREERTLLTKARALSRNNFI